MKQMKALTMCSCLAVLPHVHALEFEAPVRLESSEGVISVEGPGYASPCLADLDGDGKKDLLVGQFRGGKIRVYPGEGGLKFGKGKWLEVGGETVSVPGVW